MRRMPHENVATVLVDPLVLRDLEIELVEHDLWLWPIETAPICTDGPRMAFQVRRKLVVGQRGDWDDAAEWTPVWISFGETWRDGDEPLSWAAHQALWQVLEAHEGHVRYRPRLGGVPPLTAQRESAAHRRLAEG